MAEIILKNWSPADCTPNLLAEFRRYQDVRRCWRRENDTWVLKDIAYIGDWDNAQKAVVITQLRTCLQEGGWAMGAYDGDTLVAFASVAVTAFGTRGQYRNLDKIQTSADYRNRGIGRRLFAAACDWARTQNAEKLYISAHSAEDSIAFYRKIGCVDAVEINQRLAANEPCDCQLEFVL